MPPIKLVRTYIDKLTEKGITLSYEQIIELHDLGQSATRITDPAILTMTGRKVGNQIFYPLTLAASIWYSESAGKWFADDDEALTLCLLFAMAHSRQVDVFNETDTPRKARRRAYKWAKGCGLTAAEAFLAVEPLLNGSDDDQSNDPADWGAVIRILQQECGESREHWLLEPAIHCEKLVLDIIKKYNSDEAPDPNDPALKATYRLNKKYYEILEAHNG